VLVSFSCQRVCEFPAFFTFLLIVCIVAEHDGILSDDEYLPAGILPLSAAERSSSAHHCGRYYYLLNRCKIPLFLLGAINSYSKNGMEWQSFLAVIQNQRRPLP